MNYFDPNEENPIKPYWLLTHDDGMKFHKAMMELGLGVEELLGKVLVFAGEPDVTQNLWERLFPQLLHLTKGTPIRFADYYNLFCEHGVYPFETVACNKYQPIQIEMTTEKFINHYLVEAVASLRKAKNRQSA